MPGNYTGCGASMTQHQIYYNCQLVRDHEGQHMAVLVAFKQEPEKVLKWKWWHQAEGKRAKWAEL